MDLNEELGALTYEGPSLDFVRFRDVALDDDVRSVVAATASLDAQQLDEFRRRLDEDSSDTLWNFATRRTLQARRRSSPNMLDEAFSALSLQASLEQAPWATWLKSALFVARTLGRDLESIEQRFARHAPSRTLEHFRIARGALARIESLDQCGIAEVTTSYGTGFIETMVLRDKTSFAALGNPGRPDEVVTFAPTFNLAQLAVTLADALDETGHVRTTPIVQDQLAAMSFALHVRGSFVPTLGCLSCYADSEHPGRSFKVFVAQVAPSTDTVSLVEGARAEGRCALALDERVVLLEAPPRFDEDDGQSPDLEEFVPLVIAAFASSAAWGARPG